MPFGLNDFVVMLRNDRPVQGLGQIAMQIRDDDLIVIGSGQQIVSVCRETNAAYVARVWLVDLHDTRTSYVVQAAGGIFMSRGHQ